MITHHPSDIVLAEFANSVLDEAAALVVGTHIAQCAQCRQAVHRFEVLGGAVMEQEAPAVAMTIGADDLLARTDILPEPRPRPVQDEAIAGSGDPAGGVDRLLSLYDGDQWRWIGPGVHWRPLSVPSESGLRVFMLKARAGTTLPEHKHSGIEWTSVLQGAFSHAHGRYGTGDFDEADSSVEHNPVVEKGEDCICLVAMNGKLELQGLIGRLLQPFVRL